MPNIVYHKDFTKQLDGNSAKTSGKIQEGAIIQGLWAVVLLLLYAVEVLISLK